jgi:hypothetical protein
VRERAEEPIAGALPSLEAVLDWLVETAPRELAQPENRRLLAHLVGSVPNSPRLMAAYWRSTLEPRWSAFGELLAAAGSDRGSRRSASIAPDTLADVIAGALLWRAVVRPGRADATQLRRFLVEVLQLLGP